MAQDRSNFVARIRTRTKLSIVFQKSHGRSSMVSTPIFVGVADEVGIEVARIAGHSRPTRRCLDAFGLAGDLHLGDDEPYVVAMEDIDVPGPAAKGFAISGLLDQRKRSHSRSSMVAASDTGMAYSKVPSGMRLEFGGGISGNMRLSFQAARSIG